MNKTWPISSSKCVGESAAIKKFQTCYRRSPAKTNLTSRFLFRGQFFKPRIVSDRIPDRVYPQKSPSNLSAGGYLQQPLQHGNRMLGVAQKSVDVGHG